MSIGEKLKELLEKSKEKENVNDQENQENQEEQEDDKLNEESDDKKKFYMREKPEAKPFIEKLIVSSWSSGKKLQREAARCFSKLAESDDKESNKFLREVDRYCTSLKEAFMGKDDDEEEEEEKPVEEKKKNEVKDDVSKVVIDDEEVKDNEGPLGLSKYFMSAVE